MTFSLPRLSNSKKFQVSKIEICYAKKCAPHSHEFFISANLTDNICTLEGVVTGYVLLDRNKQIIHIDFSSKQEDRSGGASILGFKLSGDAQFQQSIKPTLQRIIDYNLA